MDEFWAGATESWTGTTDRRYSEVDVMEAATSTGAFSSVPHDWIKTAAGTPVQDYYESQDVRSFFAGVDTMQWHTYGVRLQTAAQLGLTHGVITWYFDGAPTASVPESLAGRWGTVETDHMCWIFGIWSSGGGDPTLDTVIVKDFQVWQHP